MPGLDPDISLPGSDEKTIARPGLAILLEGPEIRACAKAVADPIVAV